VAPSTWQFVELGGRSVGSRGALASREYRRPEVASPCRGRARNPEHAVVNALPEMRRAISNLRFGESDCRRIPEIEHRVVRGREAEQGVIAWCEHPVMLAGS